MPMAVTASPWWAVMQQAALSNRIQTVHEAHSGLITRVASLESQHSGQADPPLSAPLAVALSSPGGRARRSPPLTQLCRVQGFG